MFNIKIYSEDGKLTKESHRRSFDAACIVIGKTCTLGQTSEVISRRLLALEVGKHIYFADIGPLNRSVIVSRLASKCTCCGGSGFNDDVFNEVGTCSDCVVCKGKGYIGGSND